MKKRNPLKKTVCLYVLPLLMIAAPGVGWGQAGISVSPVRLDLSGRPGETVSGDLRIINSGKGPFLLRCYAGDWWFTDKETSVFAEPGTYREHSAAPWIRFTPNDIIVPPKSVQIVKVTAAIPGDAQGSRFAVLFTEMGEPAQKGGETTHVFLAGRLGVVASVTVMGTEEPAMEIRKFQAVPPSHRSPMAIRYTVLNKGNIVLRPKGKVLFLTPEKQLAGQTEIEGPNLLPGQVRDMEAVFTGTLPKGRYTAIMNLNLNDSLKLDPKKAIYIYENSFTLP